jgi:hypothetical protein
VTRTVKHCLAVAAIALLTACSSSPPEAIIVSGNGRCHPSQALPPAIVIETVPAKDTDANGLYDLLADSRKALGTAAGQYRKLWDECVGKGASNAGGDHVGGK